MMRCSEEVLVHLQQELAPIHNLLRSVEALPPGKVHPFCSFAGAGEAAKEPWTDPEQKG